MTHFHQEKIISTIVTCTTKILPYIYIRRDLEIKRQNISRLYENFKISDKITTKY